MDWLIVKRNWHFIFRVLVSCLVLPCAANWEVQSAAETALKNVTGSSLGKLYRTRSEATTPARQEMVIQACVAGLYAIDDVKNAVKLGKGLGDFTNSFVEDCSQCKGKGTTQRTCYRCKGTGKCPNGGCREGVVIEPGVSGNQSEKPCSICGGTGKCTNCSGEGASSVTCTRCWGAKGFANKGKALDTCKELLRVLVVAGKNFRDEERPENQEENARGTRNPSAGNSVVHQGAVEKFLLRGISDNESGTHPKFRAHKFDFGAYHEWTDDKNTSVQSERIFNRLLENSFRSVFYKDYVRCRFALVPNGLTFAVNDVEQGTVNGRSMYEVGLQLLAYGESFPNDWKKKWTGQPLQNNDAREYLQSKLLLPLYVKLVVADKVGCEAENWRKGTVLVSKGWVYDIRIIDAVRTYKDGSQSPVKEVSLEEPYLFCSMDERMSFEGASKVSFFK